MIRFVLGALLINVGALALLYFGRGIMSRMALPSLWRLGSILLAIVMTLALAKVTLS